MIHRDLPLIDLHRHLEGSLRLETLVELAHEHDIPLPGRTVEELRPHVQVTEPQPDLMAFLSKFRWLTAVMVDLDVCRRLAYENVATAQEEGLDYLELRFSPYFMAEPHGLSPEAVVEAVVDGVDAGVCEFDVPVGLIGTLSRTYGPAIAHRELAAILQHRDDFVALDLAGDELQFPAELFVEHFARARRQGLPITVHAGEAAGAASVWAAIRHLGAQRIGHCVEARHDPELLDYLATHGIGVEANLTSNVQTSSVNDYADHPIEQFLDHGIRATLNSDDPGISGIDLAHEFDVAAPAAGLSEEHLRQVQNHALEIAFLSTEDKAALRAKAACRGDTHPRRNAGETASVAVRDVKRAERAGASPARLESTDR